MDGTDDGQRNAPLSAPSNNDSPDPVAGSSSVRSKATATAATFGQLIPPDLGLSPEITHEGGVIGRQSNPTSLLRHLSTPGHIHGEGLRRIFIGEHPNDPHARLPGPAAHGTSSRSFLVGIEALWAEERAAKHHHHQVNRVQKPTVSATAGATGAVQGGLLVPDHVETESTEDDSGLAGQQEQQDEEESDDEVEEDDDDADAQSSTSSSSDGTVSSDSEDDLGGRRAGRERHRERTASQRTGETNADNLFAKLRGRDNKKHLTEASSPTQTQRTQDDVPFDITSRTGRHSPQPAHLPQAGSLRPPFTAADTQSSLAPSFHTAQAFLTTEGLRATNKPLLPETIERMQGLTNHNAPSSGLLLEVHHQLTRRQSDTFLPDTASDTVVELSTSPIANDRSRPKPLANKMSKSVRWDVSQGKKSIVPRPRDAGHSARPKLALDTTRTNLVEAPSGDQPIASPSEVLARPNPLEHPAEGLRQQASTSDVPVFGQLVRSASTESSRLLMELADTKEASLPPGVEKLERMLVRVGWTMREDLPDDLDEMSARKFPVRYERWEEMAVLWKRSGVEVWGSYVSRARSHPRTRPRN